jgi:hypothetical protein
MAFAMQAIPSAMTMLESAESDEAARYSLGKQSYTLLGVGESSSR